MLRKALQLAVCLAPVPVLAAQAVPEAGPNQSVDYPASAVLAGAVLNQSPLDWWTADGNNATENYLLKFNSSTGVVAVGPLHDAGGLIFGYPADMVNVGATVYGVDATRRYIYTLDAVTAVCTPLGLQFNSAWTNVYSLAYDPTRDVIFGVDQLDKQLISFNRSTGQGTPVGAGTLVGYPNVRSLAYRASNDRLYAVDQSTDMLVALHPATGALTPVVTVTPDPLAQIEDLQFVGDVLYASNQLSVGGGMTVAQLVSIDLGSGVLQDVGPQVPDCSPHVCLVNSLPESVQWSQQSGPGTASFADASALDTTVTFSAPGVYVIELTVSGASGAVSDTVTVTSDGCPGDPAKVVPGVCGCGLADADGDGDGWLDCEDNCANVYNPSQLDQNANGVGDACESPGNGVVFCAGDGTASACPCLQFGSAGEGCANSGGHGARLINTGGSSVSYDDALLVTTQLPPNKQAQVYCGNLQKNGGNGVTFGDGLRCVGGATRRFPLANAGAAGQINLGHPVAAAGGLFSAGTTWYFQTWYRDGGTACGHPTNLSNGLAVTFTP